MGTVTFEQAREIIKKQVRAARRLVSEEVAFEQAAWRVLAEDVTADRDYPTLARSLRDGYAVRSEDLPGSVNVIAEVRAGDIFRGAVGAGQGVEIMTGAPVPDGANQVVMIEHTTRDGNRMSTERPGKPGEWVNPQAGEARQGDTLIPAGQRVDYATVAQMATVGQTRAKIYRRPKVAIIATGDEIVPVSETPEPWQIRNSNAHSLAVQVERAGGEAEILPVALDEYGPTRELIERGLRSDLVLLSGGVSAGKYDIVEPVLADLGAEFYFDATLIQPGRPTVFGRARETFFFGLPGNPASTMVTFEVFARAALELLAGHEQLELPFLPAQLTRPFRHKTGLTRFLPAHLSPDGSELTPIGWRGSSDVPAVARANVYMVVDADKAEWAAGDWMRVMPK